MSLHHLNPPDQNIWYFAYGSNLSSSIFTGTRKIIPLATKSVSIPGWTLVFDIGGLPYIEPAYASIQPILDPSNEKRDVEKGAPMTVEGVAYLVTPAQLRSIMASEGGLYAYRRVVLRALPLHPVDGDAAELAVVTLVTGEGRTPAGVPSRRYMVCLYYSLYIHIRLEIQVEMNPQLIVNRTSSKPAPENNISLPLIRPISPPSRHITLPPGTNPPGSGSERSSSYSSGFHCTNYCSGCWKRRGMRTPRAMRLRGCVRWC